jgi:hypothetical protein
MSPEAQMARRRRASTRKDGAVAATATGEEIAVFQDLKNGACMAFTPGGKRLAASGREGKVHFWDVPPRKGP